VSGWAEPVRIVRCGSCGHVFRSPRPAEGDADGYYDEAYYRGTGDEGAYAYEDERTHEPLARARARGRLRRMESELPGTGRLLEVGCSFGLFLDEARRRGWDPVGVDVSPYAAESARDALGLDVRAGKAEALDEPDGSFDAAYLSETIEHLADPRRTLRRLAALLREGGLLVVGTGNVGSLAARVRGGRWGYLMPGHLQLFSIESLARALRASGYERVRTFVPDDRGLRGAREIAAAAGTSRVRAMLAWLARAPRIGGLAVGAGMVAYARRAPS
jgi:SAM-dependent methyltransferase